MMLRTPFEEELEKLHNQFYAMGTEVAAQLKKSLRAFISHDLELAKEVIENDEIVNNYETKLEKKSLELIALQQPVSSDLWVTMRWPSLKQPSVLRVKAE